MKTQIVCIGGWGFNHHVFDHLLNQINLDFDRININTTALEPILLNDDEKIVITWSFGYTYFLKHINKFKNIKCVIALSPTSKMIKEEDYAFAWPKEIIDNMIHQLYINYEKVLIDFYRNCSENNLSNYFIKEKNKDLVIKSLNILSNIDLRQIENPYPSLIIHGDNDKIIYYKHSEFIHDNHLQSIYYKISGNHFILHKEEVITIVSNYIRSFYD